MAPQIILTLTLLIYLYLCFSLSWNVSQGLSTPISTYCLVFGCEVPTLFFVFITTVRDDRKHSTLSSAPAPTFFCFCFLDSDGKMVKENHVVFFC